MEKIKQFIKSRKSYHWIRYSLSLVIIILSFISLWVPITLLIAVLIAFIVVLISNARLRKRSRGNGIIYGSRGGGKGLTLNHIILKDKTKPFVNVPYHKCLVSSDYMLRMRLIDKDAYLPNDKYILDGVTYAYHKYIPNDKMYGFYHTELLEDLSEYFNSIAPLNVESFIKGGFDFVKKKDKFEGRNVYIDDINVAMPNWADSLLKNKYASMPPFLAINRHTYGAYCVITTQDRERPYKIIKELQTDFSVKAIKTAGFGFLWKCIPILNAFVYTKYIYHELPKSADMLPFSAVGLINETAKHGYLTSGQATKEVYEATNGVIAYGFVLQLKKDLRYDTRGFHMQVYGYQAPKK